MKALDAKQDKINRLETRIEVLSETWFDPETEITWRPPTAWAYAQLCKVHHKNVGLLEEARQMIKSLQENLIRVVGQRDTLKASRPFELGEKVQYSAQGKYGEWRDGGSYFFAGSRVRPGGQVQVTISDTWPVEHLGNLTDFDEDDWERA